MQPPQAQTEVKDWVPQRQWLKDLELPPEIAAEVRESCVRHGWVSRLARQQAEDEAKLQWFFGGKTVAYRLMPEGRVVLAVGHFGSDEFGKFLASLSREDRCKTIVRPVSLWDDPISYIGTLFSEDH